MVWTCFTYGGSQGPFESFIAVYRCVKHHSIIIFHSMLLNNQTTPHSCMPPPTSRVAVHIKVCSKCHHFIHFDLQNLQNQFIPSLSFAEQSGWRGWRSSTQSRQGAFRFRPAVWVLLSWVKLMINGTNVVLPSGAESGPCLVSRLWLLTSSGLYVRDAAFYALEASRFHSSFIFICMLSVSWCSPWSVASAITGKVLGCWVSLTRRGIKCI